MAKIDLSKLDEILECAVCLEVLDETSKVLPCQHCFCGGCLRKMASTMYELACPECRTPFSGPIDELPSNILLVRLLDTLRNTQVEQPAQLKVDNSVSKLGHDLGLLINGLDENAKEQGKCTPLPGVTNAIALYSYTPEDSNELSFKRHDQLLLLERVDEDWYVGQSCADDSHRGLVPANYVRLLTDSNSAHREVSEPVKTNTGTGLNQVPSGSDTDQESKDRIAQVNTFQRAVALYDFDASNVIVSTSVDEQTNQEFLTFAKGDTLTLHRQIDANWFVGATDANPNRVALCPSTYVRVTADSVVLPPSHTVASNTAVSSTGSRCEAQVSAMSGSQDALASERLLLLDPNFDCVATKSKTDMDLKTTGGLQQRATLPRACTQSPVKQSQPPQSLSQSVRVTTLGGARGKTDWPKPVPKGATPVATPTSKAQPELAKFVAEPERPKTPVSSASAAASYASAANVTLFGCGKSALNEVSVKRTPTRAVNEAEPTSANAQRVIMHRETPRQYEPAGRSNADVNANLLDSQPLPLPLSLTFDSQRSRSLTRSATERALLVGNGSFTLASTRARSVERPVAVDQLCRRTASTNRIIATPPDTRPNAGALAVTGRRTTDSSRQRSRKSPTAKLWRTLSAGSSRFFESLRTTVKRIGTHRASVSDADDDDDNYDDVSVSDDDECHAVDSSASSKRRALAAQRVAMDLANADVARSRSRTTGPASRQCAAPCQCANCRQRRLAQQVALSPRRVRAAVQSGCRSAESTLRSAHCGSDERLHKQHTHRAPHLATLCTAVRRFVARAAGQLDVHVGDMLYVVQARSDGWCEAVNSRTSEVGFVPLVYLEPADSEPASLKF